MVSLSNLLTLGLIGGGILAFYRLGGAGGIGSRIGGGFTTLFDSFTNALNPLTNVIENLQNPALNPLRVAAAEVESAVTIDPNADPNKFVDPAGKYDPYDPYKITSTNPIAQNDMQGMNGIQNGIPIGSANGIAANPIHTTSWNLESLSDVVITGMYSSSTGGSGGSTGGSSGGSSGGRTTGSSSGGGSAAGSSSTSSSGGSSGGGNSGGSSGGSTGGSTGSNQPSSRRGTYSGGRRG